MNCKRCQRALSLADIRPDGTLVCPGCGAVYRRRAEEEAEAPKPREERRPACPAPLLPEEPDSPCRFEPDGDGPYCRRGRRRESAMREEEDDAPDVPAGNAIARTLKFIGLLFYAAAAVLSAVILIGTFYAGRGGFGLLVSRLYAGTTVAAAVLTVLLAGFVLGTLLLGFGETVRLLDEISRKLDRQAGNKK